MYPPLFKDILESHIAAFCNKSRKLVRRQQALRSLSSLGLQHPFVEINLSKQLMQGDMAVLLQNSLLPSLKQQLFNVVEARHVHEIQSLKAETTREAVLEDFEKKSVELLSSIEEQFFREKWQTVLSFEIRRRFAAAQVMLAKEASKPADMAMETTSTRPEVSIVSNVDTSSAQTRSHLKRGPHEAEEQQAKRLASEENAQVQGQKNQEIKTVVSLNTASCHNLSNLPLPPVVKTLLSKGANFTPLIRPSLEQLKEIYNVAKEQLVCRLGMTNSSSFSWILDLYDREFRNAVEAFHSSSHFDKSARTVREFLTSGKLIVKEADKNMGLTVMKYDWYNNQVTSHLDDTKYYQKVQAVDSLLIKKKLWNLTDKYHSVLTKDEYKLLRRVPIEPLTPEFYVIPKLHKNPHSSRPIVPSLDWITTNASKWLDKQLQPLLQHFPWIIPNSMAAIQKIESTTARKKCFLVSADATTLYTNINLDEGIRKIKALLLSKKVEYNRACLIADLLDWVMKHNYFQYQGNWYWQTCGTAMGSNVAPTFANLFVAFHEESLMKRKDINFPKVYFRYIDDVFFVWRGTEEGLKKFQATVNSLTPSLEFNFVNKRTRTSFLDLEIYKGRRFKETGTLDIRPYSKPGNPHLYTDPSTYQPNHIKYNWIQGECVRLVRNSSNEYRFNEALNLFKMNLLKRNYPLEVVEEQFNKVSYAKRESYLVPKPKKQKDSIFIMIPNISGRHIVVKYIRKIVAHLSNLGACNEKPSCLSNEEFSRSKEVSARAKIVTVVVTRGRTVIDIVNASSKAVLKSAHEAPRVQNVGITAYVRPLQEPALTISNDKNIIRKHVFH
jgi:hypothetical protein